MDRRLIRLALAAVLWLAPFAAYAACTGTFPAATACLGPSAGAGQGNPIAITNDYLPVVSAAKGGLGAALTDPNADRLIAWDDSASAAKAIPLADILTEASPAAGDFLIVYTAEGALVKVDWDDLPAGGGGTDDQTAAEVPFTPVGNIAATDVQAAIDELDDEKQPLDTELTSLAGASPNGVSLVTAADYAAMALLIESAIEAVVEINQLQGEATAANLAADSVEASEIAAGAVGTSEAAALDAGDTTSGQFADARIDGSAEVDEIPAFVGDSGSGGVKGLVPAPATGDATKFLRGDATWQTIGGGGDALTSNPLSQFAATTSAQLRGVLSDESGTGNAYFQGGDIGTPSAGVLTNATGLPIGSGVSGLGTGVATFLGTPSSANLAAAVTGETGSGAAVFATSPALVTPDIGTPSAGVLTNATGLPLASGVTGDLPFANLAQIATDRLVGRDTAATGDVEELTVGGGIEFTGSGGIQRSALTGDVTATAGSGTTTIADDAVGEPKLDLITGNTAGDGECLLARPAGSGGTLEFDTCPGGGVSAPSDTPSSLVLKQSAWGDLVFDFDITGSAENRTFELQIDNGGYTTAKIVTGQSFVDFPVEESIPFINSLVSWDGTTTWAFDWRVREVYPSALGNGSFATSTASATVDDSFVTDYILAFGHSGIDAHFSFVDDWASGSSRATVSWATMRAKYAEERGLRLVQVSPINASVAGSSIEDEAQADVTDTNYWYDLDTPADGPLLTALDTLVSGKESLIKAAFVAWGGPDIDAIITPDGAASPVPTFERMEASMIAVFASIRTIVSNPELPIYFQTASRLWEIDADPPEIVMGGEYHRLIGIEESIAQTDPYTGLGSPSAGESIEDFIQDEGTGNPARHLIPAVNHRVAYQIGEAMARAAGIDRLPQYRGDTYQLPEATDLDGVTATGFYNVLDPVNGPGVGFAWYLQVLRWDQAQSDSIRQVLMSGSAGWWQRSNVEGVWEPWVHLAGGSNKRTIPILAAALKNDATNPASCGDTYDSGSNDVTIPVCAFDTGATEERAGIMIYPQKSYDGGTFTYRYRWTNTGGSSTQTVQLEVGCVFVRDDDALNATLGSTVTQSDTWHAQNDMHVSAESAAVTCGGTWAEGAGVFIRFSRDTSVDTMSGDMLLLGVDWFYTTNAANDS